MVSFLLDRDATSSVPGTTFLVLTRLLPSYYRSSAPSNVQNNSQSTAVEYLHCSKPEEKTNDLIDVYNTEQRLLLTSRQ